MTLNDLKVLRSKGAASNQRLRKTPTGKQLVGRTLSLELPQRAEARPRSGLRKEQSSLGLSRPGSAALRLNTLDGVSSVYKRPGPAQDVLEKQRHRRSATPSDGRRRISTDALAGRGAAGAASEMLGALCDLDSMSSEQRAAACRDVLLNLAAHEPVYKEILERVSLEYETERAVLVREASHTKKSLLQIQTAQKRAEEALAALKKENQQLHLDAKASAAAAQQLQEEAARLNRENLETQKRLESMATSASGHDAPAKDKAKDAETDTKKAAATGQAAGKGLIAAAKADVKAQETAEQSAKVDKADAGEKVSDAAAASAGESVVLDGSSGAVYVPSEEEVVEYAVQLGMELPDDADLLWIALEGLQAELPPQWKPCASPEGEIYYFNFETGESLWDRPDIEIHRKQYFLEKAKQRSGGVADAALADADGAAGAGGEDSKAGEGSGKEAVKEQPSAAAIEAAHETSSSDEELDPDADPPPGFDMKGNIMTDMTLPRPKEVPALDFDTLAAKLKEEEEQQKAAEEEAKRLASMPLPPGWETAVSRSTGQTYYVNTQTGATQYEFPDGPAEVWKVYGASHTYGSKGIRDKPKRRNSL